MAASSEQEEKTGDTNSGGFHPYNPHLPPRATGCLQMLLTGGYQPAPCWKLINQLHSVSGASGYSCISSPCSKVICWNPSAAGLGQALSMACNSPSLRQPATLLDSSFTEPTRWVPEPGKINEHSLNLLETLACGWTLKLILET